MDSPIRKEQKRKGSLTWYYKHHEDICARRRLRRRDPYRLALYRQYQRKWIDDNRAHLYARGKLARLALKNEVFMAYGGWICACCSEQEPKFLSLDHINNDGAADRREYGYSYRIFARLRREGFPPGYQILCFNCNCGKRDNGGICPHQKHSDLPITSLQSSTVSCAM